MAGDDRLRGPEAPPWHVLLIGGCSGTGKTVLGHLLARHFGVALTQVDDLRLALQRVTTPVEQPDLHAFLTEPAIWRQPAEALRDRLIGVARALTPALDAVVEHHLDTPYPLILEGDGIVPSFAARWIASNRGNSRVRAVFLVEPSEGQSLADMLARGRGIERHSTDEQQTQARMNWQYGTWLQEEADRRGVPMLSARPRDTLLSRFLTAIA
jgi:2-phosphoglycerate kinase